MGEYLKHPYYATVHLAMNMAVRRICITYMFFMPDKPNSATNEHV